MLVVSYAMVRSLKAVLDLQALTGFHQPPLVEIRLDVLKTRWVDFVDGDVHMQVIGIDVDRRNSLMIGVTDRRAQLVLDLVKHVEGGRLAGGK
ncbi:hypothetical protein GCM10007923_64160 [Shinella yambaruensis]|uniref:Uncharacterized protein n=1 Tax=Shinella yambaruensis TaxID=415996 RepID=A0ABQ5ZX02_9HYPH|nr:hypothetical protein GCM10007923_64160 [Shinella yambaruensis]